ncbi:MAG: VWA domain-containing protein [Archangium sp.]|nr:VWA domain-containing protein [Archangium sp.]
MILRSSLLCLALAACGGPRLTATLPPDVRVDTYAQQSASKIDVLWVVDNSGSMAPRQENLARNFQSFITEFTRNAVDFRIAVTTTDIFKEAGAFVGNPKVITSQTPNLTAAFAANVRVGITGAPYEVGMEAARLALENVKTQNDTAVTACKRACKTNVPSCPADCETKTSFSFLRPDAYLYIVFVSDEDDKSSQDTRFFYRYFETVKGVGNDGMVATAAIMGDVPENTCGAAPGLKYKALSDLTGGEVGSLCDENFSATLKKLASNAVGLKRKFALQEKPNVQTIQVFVRYPCTVAADVTAACASIDRAACTDAPQEGAALVCTARQGGTDGWSYEAASNVVFFAGDSVPGLNGQVELQYYEEGKGPL